VLIDDVLVPSSRNPSMRPLAITCHHRQCARAASRLARLRRVLPQPP
jgi:hypothetical protein